MIHMSCICFYKGTFAQIVTSLEFAEFVRKLIRTLYFRHFVGF